MEKQLPGLAFYLCTKKDPSSQLSTRYFLLLQTNMLSKME